MCSALLYLHERGFEHLSLAPDAIKLTDEDVCFRYDLFLPITPESSLSSYQTMDQLCYRVVVWN